MLLHWTNVGNHITGLIALIVWSWSVWEGMLGVGCNWHQRLCGEACVCVSRRVFSAFFQFPSVFISPIDIWPSTFLCAHFLHCLFRLFACWLAYLCTTLWPLNCNYSLIDWIYVRLDCLDVFLFYFFLFFYIITFFFLKFSLSLVWTLEHVKVGIFLNLYSYWKQ